MREYIIWTLLLIMMTIVAVAAYVASQGAASADIASNGSFGDAIYLGTLDAKMERCPILPEARLSQTELERRADFKTAAFFGAFGS